MRFLARALESLCAQSFPELEIVAVDDGSTDDTPRLLEDWAKRDGRLRVVRREHAGLVPALNAGLGEARGELIARMDADDIAHPRRLEWQVALLDERPEGLRPEEYLLVAVGAEGARQKIRAELAARGLREPEDYRTMV